MARPAVAEMQFEARPNEPFLMFMADKTEPGVYNPDSPNFPRTKNHWRVSAGKEQRWKLP
jgi:hypothetical protein